MTAHLRSACEGKTPCRYIVDHTVIGDPAYGCPKDYVATWSCGSGPPQSTQAAPEAGFGSPIDLRC